MTPRILHVVPSLGCGTSRRQLAALAGGLASGGFDVHVCALSGNGAVPPEFRQSEIPLSVIGQDWTYDLAAWWRLRRLIAGLKPDVVQTWLFTANAYGGTAALAAGVKHRIASQRDEPARQTWTQATTDRYVAKRSDALVVGSPAAAQACTQQGLPADKIRLIRNGVSPPPPAGVTREQIVAELRLPAGAKLIGAVARLEPCQRIKDLIWATDLLKVIRDDVHLLIIGDGPFRDQFERYARLCHNTDKVHFLGRRDDLERLLPHFDLLWQAGERETIGIYLMEAMACGVPVVGSDICDHRDLVIHGETGYLAPIGDRANLARYAHKILEDPALAASMGERARKVIATRFTIDSMVGEHAALYREILG